MNRSFCRFPIQQAIEGGRGLARSRALARG
jgi:hypothetical protein